MLIDYIESYIKNYTDINVHIKDNYKIDKLFEHLKDAKSTLYIENYKIENNKDLGII